MAGLLVGGAAPYWLAGAIGPCTPSVSLLRPPARGMKKA